MKYQTIMFLFGCMLSYGVYQMWQTAKAVDATKASAEFWAGAAVVTCFAVALAFMQAAFAAHDEHVANLKRKNPADQ